MKNPLWFIIWLVLLIFLSFFVAAFCAGWYIIIYPITVCIPGLSVSCSLYWPLVDHFYNHFTCIIAGTHGFAAARNSVPALLRPGHDGVQIALLILLKLIFNNEYISYSIIISSKGIEEPFSTRHYHSDEFIYKIIQCPGFHNLIQ